MEVFSTSRCILWTFCFSSKVLCWDSPSSVLCFHPSSFKADTVKHTSSLLSHSYLIKAFHLELAILGYFLTFDFGSRRGWSRERGLPPQQASYWVPQRLHPQHSHSEEAINALDLDPNPKPLRGQHHSLTFPHPLPAPLTIDFSNRGIIGDLMRVGGRRKSLNGASSVEKYEKNWSSKYRRVIQIRGYYSMFVCYLEWSGREEKIVLQGREETTMEQYPLAEKSLIFFKKRRLLGTPIIKAMWDAIGNILQWRGT